MVHQLAHAAHAAEGSGSTLAMRHYSLTVLDTFPSNCSALDMRKKQNEIPQGHTGRALDYTTTISSVRKKHMPTGEVLGLYNNKQCVKAIHHFLWHAKTI